MLFEDKYNRNRVPLAEQQQQQQYYQSVRQQSAQQQPRAADSYRLIEQQNQRSSYKLQQDKENKTHQQVFHHKQSIDRPSSTGQISDKINNNNKLSIRPYSGERKLKDSKDVSYHRGDYNQQYHPQQLINQSQQQQQQLINQQQQQQQQQQVLRRSIRESNNQMKGSTYIQPQPQLQLQKQNQHFYQQYFSQKENIESNTLLLQPEVIKSQTLKIHDYNSNSFIEPERHTQSTKNLLLVQNNRKTESDTHEQKNKQQLPIKNQDYQEYRKLQDKLQYLENKIVNIKSHIETTNQQITKPSIKPKENTKPVGLTAKFFSNKPAPEPNKKIEKKEESTSQQQQQQSQQSQQSQQIKSNLAEELKNRLAKNNIKKPESNQYAQAPTLSQLVTQVKQVTPQSQSQQQQQLQIQRQPQLKKAESTQQLNGSIKNIITKPESAKAVNSTLGKGFTRKSSSDLQKYQSAGSIPIYKEPLQGNFLFYVSSVIKNFMTTDVTKSVDQAREHLLQSMQAIQYGKTMKSTPLNILEEKRVNIPRKEIYQNKKTIIFDLDETLIHCNESVQVPGDVILPIKFPTGELIEASINIRPFAQQILQTLSRHFELVVFTASHSCYANVVIDYLDPQKQWVSYRLFRESCVQTDEGAYIKDLRVIGNRSLSDMLIIDNATYSFALQPLNGVPILNFYENKQDQELLYLQNYLMGFRNTKDMREQNQKLLKMDKFGDFSDPIQLLQTLFKENIP